MNRILFLLVLICTSQAIYAQYVYTIKADSVKITNSCDTAELIIENHTQNVSGFLYNKGRGRTEFRRGAIALNDSLYLIGGDTINLYKGRVNVTASNGLTASNGHVKLGGELTDQTDLWFNREPDWGGSNNNGELKIWSTDGNSTLQLLDNYNSGLGYGSLIFGFDTWSPHKQANFGCAPNGFTAGTTTDGVYRRIKVDSNGVHAVSSPMTVGFGDGGPAYGINALFHLAAGNSSPGGAPLRFTEGPLLTTPENGTVEYDNYDLYFTDHLVRYKLAKTLPGQLTTNFGGPSLSAFNSVTTTLTVSGVQPGDVVNVSANSGAVNPSSIIITAYVTSANTVTLQAYNASNSAVNIASDTYKVRVIK